MPNSLSTDPVDFKPVEDELPELEELVGDASLILNDDNGNPILEINPSKRVFKFYRTDGSLLEMYQDDLFDLVSTLKTKVQCNYCWTIFGSYLEYKVHFETMMNHEHLDQDKSYRVMK